MGNIKASPDRYNLSKEFDGKKIEDIIITTSFVFSDVNFIIDFYLTCNDIKY